LRIVFKLVGSLQELHNDLQEKTYFSASPWSNIVVMIVKYQPVKPRPGRKAPKPPAVNGRPAKIKRPVKTVQQLNYFA
jgi:hypothetical protein